MRELEQSLSGRLEENLFKFELLVSRAFMVNEMRLFTALDRVGPSQRLVATNHGQSLSVYSLLSIIAFGTLAACLVAINLSNNSNFEPLRLEPSSFDKLQDVNTTANSHVKSHQTTTRLNQSHPVQRKQLLQLTERKTSNGAYLTSPPLANNTISPVTGVSVTWPPSAYSAAPNSGVFISQTRLPSLKGETSPNNTNSISVSHIRDHASENTTQFYRVNIASNQKGNSYGINECRTTI